MTKVEWAEAVKPMRLLWPGRSFTVEVADEWYKHLSSFWASDIQTAIADLGEQSDRLPSLAQLIAAAKEARKQATASAPLLTSPEGVLGGECRAMVQTEAHGTWALPYGDRAIHNGPLPDDWCWHDIGRDAKVLLPINARVTNVTWDQ